jgi:hypothetical protein
MSSTSITADVPMIEQWMTSVRSQYRRALAASADGRSFSALDATLFVDQVRLVVVTAGDPEIWSQHEGKACIANTSIDGCIHLAPFVGTRRLLRALGVQRILSGIAATDGMVVAEPVVARFINLLVVEPIHRPDHELAIWLAIALQLATGRGDDDLHTMLPPLLSDHDVLHAQIPPGIPNTATLRPRKQPALETWPAFQVRLLAQIHPELVPKASSLHDDHERTAFLHDHEALARSYIRDHVLAERG